MSQAIRTATPLAEISRLLDSNAALRDELAALRSVTEGLRGGALGKPGGGSGCSMFGVCKKNRVRVKGVLGSLYTPRVCGSYVLLNCGDRSMECMKLATPS